MDTVKIEKKQVKMVAHRGLSGIERENTVAAFIAAGNRSYYGIETDVHMTADGELVVIHDNTTGRVSDVDVTIEEQTLAQLQKIRINDITGQGMAPRRDLGIPSLADYIDICHKYDKVAVLEIKGPFTAEGLQKMVEVVKAHGHLDKTIFISFGWDYLVELRRLLPDQPLQFLTDACDDNRLEEMIKQNIGLDIYYPHLNQDMVNKLHAHGLPVNCWTCDKADAGEQLVAMGVDFITSNILE